MCTQLGPVRCTKNTGIRVKQTVDYGVCLDVTVRHRCPRGPTGIYESYTRPEYSICRLPSSQV